MIAEGSPARRQVWAVVPVKDLGRAKTRLSHILTPSQRATLMLNLLKHTLTVLQTGGPDLAGVAVVSPDPAVLRLARESGVWALPETPQDQTEPDARLNTALSGVARRLAEECRPTPTDLLILPADLPLLTSADITALLGAGQPGEAVLANDWQWQGTNGLLLDLATALDFHYQFGPDSFARHRQALTEAGIRVKVCDRPGLGYDLDYPADFERLPTTLQKALL